jgi:hypothetical protein
LGRGQLAAAAAQDTEADMRIERPDSTKAVGLTAFVLSLSFLMAIVLD